MLYILSCFAQDEFTLSAEYIPYKNRIIVFTPKKYKPWKQYPAVFLLHGHTGDYRSWDQLIGLQQYADDYKFIFICPDGFYESYYFDSPVKKQWQYETHFLNDVYPEILNRYSIDTSAIFITGLSMGGSGAMYLFLRNPDLFKSAGSSSGVLSLHYSGNKTKCLSDLIGPYEENKDRFDTYSPFFYIENIKKTDKHIIFDCGTEDHLYEANNIFRKLCDEHGVKATYISQPGKHEAGYWKESIIAHFDFFQKQVEE